jgi:hypothetical protein
MTLGAFQPCMWKTSLPFYGSMALSVGVRQSPTFHHWMAQQSKIIRHYSQNIDGIEELVPKLHEKTILTHGSIKVY